MPRNFTYIDNSNLFIEGCRLSAVRKHLPGAWTITDAIVNRVIDNEWRLNYQRLREFVCDGEIDALPTLWGSATEAIGSMIERHGFRVVTFARSPSGKEKKVDVAIAHAMTKDAYSGLIRKGVDEITLVAGDSDFIPVVEDLVANGHIVHVAFWEHASRELKNAAGRFISLNQLHTLMTSGGSRASDAAANMTIH